MRNKIIISLLCLFGLSFSVQAQNLKERLAAWGETPMTCWSYYYEKGKPAVAMISNKKALRLNKWENPYTWNAEIYDKELVPLLAKEPKKIIHEYYAKASEQGHPPALFRGSNMPGEPDDFIYFGEPGSLPGTLVLVGEYLYQLKAFQSAEKFKIEFVYTKGKIGEVQLGKMAKMFKKIENVDHYAILKEYFAQEQKVLAQKQSAWESQHAAYMGEYLLSEEKINKKNADGRKAMWEKMVGKAVRVINNKPINITIAIGKGSSGTREIKPGESDAFECNLADLYLVSPSGAKTFLLTPRDHCGTKYNVN